jgi:hypothetical protein
MCSRATSSQEVCSRYKQANFCKQTSSFIPDFRGVDASTCESLKGVGSFSVTHDHWADPNTSRAWVQEILRPHYAEYCAKNNLPLGEQKCLFLVDCWWGWLEEVFREWLRETRPKLA